MSSVESNPKIIHESVKPKTQHAKNSDDLYSVFEQSLNRYFKEVKANAANYLQSVSDLQQEIVEARKKNTESAISLQKTVADNLGMNVQIPDASLNFVKSLADQTTKAWNSQNQLMLTSLEILSKNIEAFNNNSKAFAETNKKIIDSWASIIKQRNLQAKEQ